MPMTVLLTGFYIKQQEMRLPFIHGVALKLRGQVLHGKLHYSLCGVFSQAALLFFDNACHLYCLIFKKYCRIVINNPMEIMK